jgi:hypothetical protein
MATRDKVGSPTPTASDWSRRGFLLYNGYGPKTGVDILAFPVNGDRTPFPVDETRFEERDAQFSPDGNWIEWTGV